MSGSFEQFVLVHFSQTSHLFGRRLDRHVHPIVVTAVKAQDGSLNAGENLGGWRRSVIHQACTEVSPLGGIGKGRCSSPTKPHDGKLFASRWKGHGVVGGSIDSIHNFLPGETVNNLSRAVPIYRIGAPSPGPLTTDHVRCNGYIPFSGQLIGHGPNPVRPPASSVNRNHHRCRATSFRVGEVSLDRIS